MNILSYGKGERLSVCRELLSRRDGGERLLLFPIPTTKDGVTVTGTDILLSDAVSEAGQGDVLAGYGFSEEIRQKAMLSGAKLYDAALDEEFLCDNAEITAHGAVGHLLATEKRALSDLSFGIIGYGRIGKRLLRYLLFFGAAVKVFTGNSSAREELCRSEVQSEGMSMPLSLEGIDILINTAPATLIRQEDHPFLPKGLRIIDLASGNYLEGTPGLERLPGIPEVSYPVSAGRLYAKAISGFLDGGVAN